MYYTHPQSTLSHVLCGLSYSEDGVCVERHKRHPKKHAQTASYVSNKAAKAIEQDIPHDHLVGGLDTDSNASKFYSHNIPKHLIPHCVLLHLVLIIFTVWEAASLRYELGGTIQVDAFMLIEESLKVFTGFAILDL